MHPRLEELVAYLADVRARLTRIVDATPAQAWLRRPREDAWTGAQVLEHLGKVEGSTVKMLEGLFAKALAEGLPLDTQTTSLLGSLDKYHVAHAVARWPAPERLVPSANPDAVASWTSLQKVRQRSLAAIAAVDGRDLTRISAPHPIIGSLDGYQWVQHIGAHEERHLGQLREATGA